MIDQLRKPAALALLFGASLLATSCGSSSAQLRAIQTSPDELNGLNVLIDGNTVFSSIALGVPTSYTSVSSGSRQLQVEVPGFTTPSIDQTISLSGGSKYTLITENFAASLTPVLLTDDTTAPASGDVKVRFVNAGATAANVDVYVIPPGSNLVGVAPTVTNLAFEGASSYQSLTAGSYEIFFTVAGTPNFYVDTGSLTFGAGQNRTIVMLPNTLSGFTWDMLSDLN